MVVDINVIIQQLRLKNKTESVLYQFSKQKLYISSISLYELYIGALNANKQNDVELITEDLIKLPFTFEAAKVASEIYHQLRLSNKMIEFRDIFIAATCLVNNMPIVTLNKKHFERIDGLEMINL